MKEYSKNRFLKLEYKFLKGEKNGEGKENNINGNLIFKGDYLNRKKWNRKGYYYNKIS